jgi:hypothetical protein
MVYFVGCILIILKQLLIVSSTRRASNYYGHPAAAEIEIMLRQARQRVYTSAPIGTTPALREMLSQYRYTDQHS